MIGDEPPHMDPAALRERGGRRRDSAKVSVALLAGVGFLPLVVAVGFLADRTPPPSAPRDISISDLRGPFDELPAGRRNAAALGRAAF